jgi:hypothetical protein
MGIDMVNAVLGIVLGNHNRHVLPVGGMRQEFHNAPNRQVVVGHVALAEGVAGIGSFARAVVVGYDYR